MKNSPQQNSDPKNPRNQPSLISLAQFTTPDGSKQPNSLDSEGVITALGWLNATEAIEGVYIHVPFCFHKCHYCDFYSIADADDQHERFVSRLVQEISFLGEHLSEPLKTIFIGGGTPTLLAPQLFDNMLSAVASNLPRTASCEWTIEANPETVSSELVNSMLDHGVNRVSIGSQSFNTTLLKTLERWHDPDHVSKAVECLRLAGIQNINIDMIYAIPKQTLQQVEQDIQQALDLQPEHLSCYALIYESNTPMRIKLDRGQIQRIEHDVEADMFVLVNAMLHDAGYAQYEISNFAKHGYTCQHNLLYWKNKSWWPLGPSASGHVAGRRWRNKPRLTEYLKGHALPPIEDVELLSADARAGEAFMLGLRILEGMDRGWVESLLEQSTHRWRSGVIDEFIRDGMLHWKENRLALTPSGILVADTVIAALLMYDDAMTDTTGKPTDG